MKKTLRDNSVSQAKRQKAPVKPKVVRRKTASGIRYSVSYPVPQRRKGYRPNEASQFGAEDTSSLVLDVGW